MPLSLPSAAALNAALISSAVAGFGQLDGQVGDRAGRNRHPQRIAVELALQLGHHQPDGLGRTGGGRHDVQRGRAGAAQVLVRAVLQVLVLGVGVDGGHQALDDAELVVQHLGNRRKAVRRARGVGDDVLAAVVLVVVDAQHDGDVLVGGGRGDDHLLGAGLQVAFGLGRVGEKAGGFDDDVDAQVAPRHRRRALLDLERLDLVVADDDGVLAFEADVVGQPAQDRVEFQQVRQRGVVGDVVDRDHLDVGAGALLLLRQQGPVEVAPDSTEAVDAYSDRHLSLPVFSMSADRSADSARRQPRSATAPLPRR